MDITVPYSWRLVIAINRVRGIKDSTYLEEEKRTDILVSIFQKQPWSIYIVSETFSLSDLMQCIKFQGSDRIEACKISKLR